MPRWGTAWCLGEAEGGEGLVVSVQRLGRSSVEGLPSTCHGLGSVWETEGKRCKVSGGAPMVTA